MKSQNQFKASKRAAGTSSRYKNIARNDETGRVGSIVKMSKYVIKAQKKVNMVLSHSNQVSSFKRLTHFISIPTNVIPIQDKFEQFRAAVIETCGNDRGVCPELFQKKHKLHLTLGVLTLSDDTRKQAAIDTLMKCKEQFNEIWQAKDECLRARICGIACMNNNPAKVNVLFAKIEANHLLQSVVDEVVGSFIKANLLLPNKKPLLLHMTLMNSTFARRATKKFKLNEERSLERTFDARNIIQNFENYLFGEIEIQTIHLSQFTAVGKDGYYAPSHTIDF